MPYIPIKCQPGLINKNERYIKDRAPNKIDDRIKYAIQVRDVFVDGNKGAN